MRAADVNKTWSHGTQWTDQVVNVLWRLNFRLTEHTKIKTAGEKPGNSKRNSRELRSQWENLAPQGPSGKKSRLAVLVGIVCIYACLPDLGTLNFSVFLSLPHPHVCLLTITPAVFLMFASLLYQHWHRWRTRQLFFIQRMLLTQDNDNFSPTLKFVEYTA